MKATARFISCLLLLALFLPAGAGLVSGRSNASAPIDIAPSPIIPGWAAPERQPPPPSGVIDPELARVLAAAEPEDMIRVLVLLHRQPDPERIISRSAERVDAAMHLVSSMRSMADASQASLRAYLEGARQAGRVESFTPFWIVNGIAVQARPSAILDLAAHSDVAVVQLDRYLQWVSTPEIELDATVPQSVEWGVSRIRADEVWSSLLVSGTGVVVAGVDSGVDWLHPALRANYRGYNPHGAHNHIGNWFDAITGSTYPFDGHGHGTHTMGTAVGREGVGVAPGAQWIGVRVFDSSGYGYDSWIHSGFQWLLAPGENSSLTPDIVNCSWGNDNGFLTIFQADVQALRAAGIVPVFSNGNRGPNENSVGSPASLPGAFAVGASDSYDVVASFSSRGPSPWGEIRPHVVAPGIQIRSSLPGGAYGSYQGTSMAAPHVSGVAALLRSVSPTLGVAQVMRAITSTAVPISMPVPNNEVGWGRVDAFEAVSSIRYRGFVSGTVTSAGSDLPIQGATVASMPYEGGGTATAVTDPNGRYLLVLPPTYYDLEIAAFGHASATVSGVLVLTDSTTTRNVALTPLPTGTLGGRISEAGTGASVTATVSVLDTPLTYTGSQYTFTLPSGAYTVEARRLGYRVVTSTVTITASLVTTADLVLTPSLSILLVDSGGWYYQSQIDYFRQALDELRYAYDEWQVRHIPDDVPQASDLVGYDLVVWSAPGDGPGFIGAENALTSYFDQGGRLFISGQDVGFTDGGGLLWFYAPYYREYLKVYLEQDSSGVFALEGVAGDLFDGLSLSIAGPGGADNQIYPDVVAIADQDAAAPLLFYEGDGCGGVRVGTCLDYRAVYLSFGLEAITDRELRREVMERALDWLAADPPAAAVEVNYTSPARVGLPGETVTHALRVRHLGQSGTTDVFTVDLQGGEWASNLSTPELTLSPCTSDTIVLSVTIPTTAAWGARDIVTLTVASSLFPTVSHSTVLTTHAIAPVLLVDDDRWYDQEARYRAALRANGVPFDYWSTKEHGGPSSDVLHEYPLVVWFTGYDWFRPVTVAERGDLESYLEGGGRLFISSQDLMYYHYGTNFSERFLGVRTYTESVDSDWVVGGLEDAIGHGLGPWDLDFPFPSWPDVVVPLPDTAVPFRDQARGAVALARRDDGQATVFFSFPFEALPEAARPEVAEAVVGWLSWLGSSDWSVDRQTVEPGGVATYTLRLANDGPMTVTASISNTLPAALDLVTATLHGPAVFDQAHGRVQWEGAMAAGEVVTISYQVTVTATASALQSIDNVALLDLVDHGIRFHRTATVRVSAPDLSPSSLTVHPAAVAPGGVATFTLALINGGPADVLSASASVSLPYGAEVVTGSVSWPGGSVSLGQGGSLVTQSSIYWTGVLSATSRLTLTYWLRAHPDLFQLPLYSVAFLEDGTGWVWERPAWLAVEPRRIYLPIAMRQN